MLNLKHAQDHVAVIAGQLKALLDMFAPTLGGLSNDVGPHALSLRPDARILLRSLNTAKADADDMLMILDRAIEQETCCPECQINLKGAKPSGVCRPCLERDAEARLA